jgi:HEAT repeat protein
MWRRFWWFLLLPTLVLAQDEGGGEEEDDEPDIIIDGGDGTVDGKIEIKVDPFEEPAPDDDPNKPAPVQVGTWQPPELKEGTRAELDALLARRGERVGDPGIRYRLAEFYLKHRWFPQAEAEFLACAQLDPESVRPWEGLLRVYRARPEQPDQEDIIRLIMAGGNVRIEGEPDWLPSEAERRKRMTHAFREIVTRRPDDVARRRAYLQHLKWVRDWPAMHVEARSLLARLPDDAGTRYDLAEALRKLGEREGADAALGREAFEQLEENVRSHPAHAASALRLARMIAVRDGQQAGDRIAELERRAVFALFIRRELAEVPYREDTFRMVRDLIGPRIANRLWDAEMTPAWAGDTRPYCTHWIVIHFPHAQPRNRIRVLQRLARRGDREAAGILISFLWHYPGPEYYQDTQQRERHVAQDVEDAAIASAVRLGSACYPAAERFLKRATMPQHRRRAMGILRGLKDPRAVRPLLDALAWDVDKDVAYGVAPTLEQLGDPQAIDALVDAALDVRRPLARRREAAEALASFKDTRSVEALNRLVKEKGLDLVTAYGLFRLTGDEKAAGRLEQALQGEEQPAEVVRLLAKCDDPRVEGLLLVAVAEAPRAVRPHVVALLKARYWATARAKVKDALLEEAESPTVSDFALAELGELGGADVAERLLALVEVLKGKRWAKAARALARTGDPRAVRYFSRTRILEKDPGRRRLAADLLEEAAVRRAQLERAKRG